MGIPQHYSLEIPTRCLSLIELIEKTVTADSKNAFSGALTTTMMLALATPMISLPYERIYKHSGLGDEEAYADDRVLDTAFAHKLHEAISKTSLNQIEHFRDLGWAFAKDVNVFNAARRLPNAYADKLNTEEARALAQGMSMAQFLSCIRNALAHGGIMYLDDDGQSSEGTAAMLLFVSAKQFYPDPVFDENKGKCVSVLPVTESLRLLRIRESDFRAFLSGWVAWLKDLGALDDFDRRNPFPFIERSASVATHD